MSTQTKLKKKGWAIKSIYSKKLIDVCLDENMMEANIRWTKLPHRRTRLSVIPVEITYSLPSKKGKIK